MDTIYEWLIRNTGNAHLSGNDGQYFTILNVKREMTHDGVTGLDVMVRNQNFHVLNLLVHPEDAIPPTTNELQNRNVTDTYTFANDAALIDYFSEGKIPDQSNVDHSGQYRMFVLEPTQEAGQITFPPVATDEGTQG